MSEKDYNIVHRDVSIDIVGGGMILYMIFGHVVSWTHLNSSILYMILDRLLFYFMPWFFFKSGMYYKGQSFKDIWNKRNKILYPYVFWGILGVLTNYLCNIGQLNLNNVLITPIRKLLLSGTFEGNHALWFLLTLLIVKCAYPLLAKVICNKYLFFSLLILVPLLIVLKRYYNLYYPEYLYNTVLGLLFYTSGIELRYIQYKKPVLIISVLVFITILFLYPSRIDFYHVTIIEGSAALWVVSSLAGIFIINYLGCILSVFHNCCIGILEYIGKNSMTFYVSHFIVGNVVAFVIKMTNIIPENNWVLFGIYSLSLIITLPLICRLFQNEPLKKYVGV